VSVIKNLTNEYFSAWDNYVENSKNGTFFHKAGWKTIIEEGVGHKTYFLFAEEGGEITGVLPMAEVSSVIFGKSLVSTPFCVYGGAIANDDKTMDMLYQRASEIAKELKVDYFETRHSKGKYREWPEKDLYVTFRKEMSPDPEENMAAIPRKQRAMVRKGIKAGLRTEITENVDDFYKIYSLSVRNHGTPVFSKKYFKVLKRVFAKQCEMRLVYKENRAISTVMSFYFKDEVLPYYGGGTLEARNSKAFDFMYWEIMKDSCVKGYRVFDYGRSKKGTGSYSFKKNWGFVPEPLSYQYDLIATDSIPDVNPLNPKYQLFIKIWKKLPLSVANTVGPYLAKNLG